MSDARKPKMREAAEDAPLPKLDVESQPKRAPDRPLSPEQSYLQRKAEVAQQDHEVFSEYLQEKITRDRENAHCIPCRWKTAGTPSESGSRPSAEL